MKSLSVVVFALGLFLSSSFAQKEEVIEAEIKVDGVCNMCKKRIEKSVKIDEVKFVKWNKQTKKLKIAFLSTISADSLQQRIASVGHDTEKFLAPDSVYANLPGCCLYRDNVKTH